MPADSPGGGIRIAGLNPAPAWQLKDWMWTALFLIAGIALRIPGLNQGLWVDEITTLEEHVLQPVWSIISSYETRNNHIFYSLLAHFSTGLFGPSAWALRLPAMLFGVAVIPAAYYLGRQVAPRYDALLATAFLTFSYHHVWFSQNARGYTGLLFGTVLSTILFIRLVGLRNPGYGTILAYAVTAALTCWVQLLGGAVLLAHGLIWLAGAIPWPGNRGWNLHPRLFLALLLAGLSCIALYLPTLKPLVMEIAVVPTGNSGPPVWQSWDWIFVELWNGSVRAVPGGWPAVALCWLVLVAGVAAYVQRGLLSFSILLLPILITLAVVVLFNAVIFPRFFVGSLVFVLLLGVRGGFAVGRRVLPWLNERQILAIGLALSLATAAMVPRAWLPKQDFVAAGAFLEANVLDGDGVVCIEGVDGALEYVSDGLECQGSETVRELEALEQTYHRIWLVYSLARYVDGQVPGLSEKLRQDYTLVQKYPGTVVDGEVLILLSSRDSFHSVPRHSDDE